MMPYKCIVNCTLTPNICRLMWVSFTQNGSRKSNNKNLKVSPYGCYSPSCSTFITITILLAPKSLTLFIAFITIIIIVMATLVPYIGLCSLQSVILTVLQSNNKSCLACCNVGARGNNMYTTSNFTTKYLHVWKFYMYTETDR